MITLEMDDGTKHKFNLPFDKEKKLHQLWLDTINKKICLTISEDEKIEIKLIEIINCYIGKDTCEEEKKQKTKDFLGDIPDVLKEMLFGGK
jgi:hypothetical protein